MERKTGFKPATLALERRYDTISVAGCFSVIHCFNCFSVLLRFPLCCSLSVPDLSQNFLRKVAVFIGDYVLQICFDTFASGAPLGFFGPDYFCHVRIRRCISSLDTTRPCLESSRPRATILSNANSRMISSYVASSGCDRITSVIFSFTFDISTSFDFVE